MAIEHFNGGTTITGSSINFYRLCAFKSAVGLEMKGIKMRRGPVVWRQAAREYGIRGNKAAVHAWLCAEVERQRPMQRHVVRQPEAATCDCRPDCERYLPCDCACHEPELGEG